LSLPSQHCATSGEGLDGAGELLRSEVRVANGHR